MKLAVNKRFTEFFFFIFILSCSCVEASKDRKSIHQEIVENQQRIMGKVSPTLPKEVTDIKMNEVPRFIENEKKDNSAGKTAGDSDEKGEIETEEKKEDHEEDNKDDKKDKKKEQKLTFWSGFVDSLSMIFFVEFGDRVIFLIKF